MSGNPDQGEIAGLIRALAASQRQLLTLSAGRSYMNTERTLAVWLRTALSSMIFGIAIDRLGLFLQGLSHHPDTLLGQPSTPSTLIGSALVVFAVAMALSAGYRFIAYARLYRHEFPFPAYHDAWLPAVYAAMVALFGAALLALTWGLG